MEYKCHNCSGKGWIETIIGDELLEYDVIKVTCFVCNGIGKIKIP